MNIKKYENQGISLHDFIEKAFFNEDTNYRKYKNNIPINIYETAKNFFVEANIAGYNPEEIKIEIDDNSLVLEIEEKENKEEDNKTYHYKEIHQSHFRKEIRLPNYININKAESKSKNGILTIEIPKKEENQKKILKTFIEK